MKQIFIVLCTIALFPVATFASEVPITRDVAKARCLERAAVAWAADYAHQTLLNNLASERMAATGGVSFGGAAFSRPVDSRIRYSVLAASYCGEPKEKKRVIPPRTDTPRHARIGRGGMIWRSR